MELDMQNTVIRLGDDVKDLKERVGRHSNRLNTLEQNQLQEKGELTALKGDVRIMEGTLKELKEGQDDLRKDVVSMKEDIDDLKDSNDKLFRKICILMVVVLGILFAKDSSTVSTILKAIQALGAV